MKPHLVQGSGVSIVKVSPSAGDARLSQGGPKQSRLRLAAFAVGDGLFLIAVSVAATAVMHLVHELGWTLSLTLICGMIVAMAVQTLLAMAVAPLLGSIESMVPAMVAAMISPMAVCAADLIGIHLSGWMAAAVGAATGLVVFISIAAYGFKCRARFRHGLLNR